MNDRVFIFENSGSPHETSVLAAIGIFKELNFSIHVVLGRLAHRRLAGALQSKGIEVYRTWKPRDLWACIGSIRKTDFLLFNTVGLRVVPFILLFSYRGARNLFYVRNARSWFYLEPNPQGLFSRALGHFLFYAKKLLLKKAHGLVVGSNNMRAFLGKHTQVPTAYLPFNAVKDLPYMERVGPVRVVIPGTIDFERKNNTVIADAIMKLSSEEGKNLEVVFLGRPVDVTSLNLLQGWSKVAPVKVSYYSGFISQEEFDSKLTTADVVLGVINLTHRSLYYTETYGLTKDTGVEAHAIAFSKPLVINKGYSADKILESSVVYFESAEDLSDIFKRLIADQKWLESLKRQAVLSSKNFSPDKVLTQFKDVLL